MTLTEQNNAPSEDRKECIMTLAVVLALIVLVNCFFALRFFQDLLAHRSTFMKEPGHPIALALSSFVIFLLSTFGISDFCHLFFPIPQIKMG